MGWVSESAYNKLAAQKKAAVSRMAKVREERGEAIQRVVRKAIAGGTCFGLGYARGRYPEKMDAGILGIPPELAITGACMIADAMSDRVDDYLEAIGTGAFCAWTTAEGLTAGTKAAEEA